jgi:hypothetical protein
MDMSAAALPARYGHASQADERHPRFDEYRTYRSGMSRLLVDSDDFSVWLRSTEYHEHLDDEAKHPRMAEFQAWMRANQGGGRRIPGELQGFPHNFRFWLTGGRW